MKIFSLVPIGAALLMSLPLAAQTTIQPPQTPETPSAPKAPSTVVKRSKVIKRERLSDTARMAPEAREMEVIERRIERAPHHIPVPPTPPEAPLPPDAPEMFEDVEVIENVIIESPAPLEGAQHHEIFIESPHDLRELEIDSVDNQLRVRVKKSVKETLKLRRDMEKLSRELRQKNHEYRELRVLMGKDTAGLTKALEEARKALDSAHATVLQLDSNVILIRSMGGAPHGTFNAEAYSSFSQGNFSMMRCDSTNANIYWTKNFPNGSFEHFSYQISDSIGGNSKHIVIMNHARGGGDSVPGVVRRAPSGQRSMEIYSRSGKAPQGLTMEHSTDAAASCRSQVFCFRTFCDSVQGMPKFDVKLDASRMMLMNDNIMIGADSLRIIDGKDQQMVIRVDRDSTSPDGNTRVVIITMSRSKKSAAETRTEQPDEVLQKSTTTTATGYALEANTPNPFSEMTTINFTLPKPEHATLTVYDVNGSTVTVLKDEALPAGTHTVMFDASGLSSGVYLYRLVAGGFSETKTMTVAK